MAKKNTKAESGPNQLEVLVDKVAKHLDADVLLYNAPIERHLDQRVIELCNSMRRRKNVALHSVRRVLAGLIQCQSNFHASHSESKKQIPRARMRRS